MSRQVIIDLWRKGGDDWDYFASVENDAAFWTPGRHYLPRFQTLDLTAVLEIACGQGRHSARAAPLCGVLHIMDTSDDALSVARERLKDAPNVHVHHSSDGASLPFIPDASLTAVFSYDAMVHFEAETMAAYLREIGRVLRPGGKALLHHSNTHDAPERSVIDSPGWRNFMNEDLFRHFASRGNLEVIEYCPITWAGPDSDALSTLRRQ